MVQHRPKLENVYTNYLYFGTGVRQCPSSRGRYTYIDLGLALKTNCQICLTLNSDPNPHPNLDGLGVIMFICLPIPHHLLTSTARKFSRKLLGTGNMCGLSTPFFSTFFSELGRIEVLQLYTIQRCFSWRKTRTSRWSRFWRANRRTNLGHMDTGKRRLI